ncbi:hypothetical protein B0H17DRAFT_678235 [Mycena rosella]|uniref:Uncharacterized protein n=1 Tax=Mycena rosella TaxID=1033263 RepID=A0AAD7DC36_MYCRO|nr:hypothetical protein B0H17DRAFT_678235 [Mycena rosella]
MSLRATRAIVDRAIKRRHRRAPTMPYAPLPGPSDGPRLSQSAHGKMQRAIQHAWADSMLRKYGNSVARYILFCENEGIEKDKRLPASEFLLCVFAASRVGEVAGVTARGAIAAVKAWHIVSGAPWHGGLRLRYTLRGVENLAPTDSKQPERPPFMATMLDILEEELDQNDPKDAAVFASACCAFWGQIRLGEILSTAQGSFKKGRIPTASDVKKPSTRAGSRRLKLPWTKTKGARGDEAMLCRQNGRSDPIRAVENHLSINDIPRDMPLFSYQNKRGDLVCLTRKKLLDRCNEIWARHGFRRERDTPSELEERQSSCWQVSVLTWSKRWGDGNQTRSRCTGAALTYSRHYMRNTLICRWVSIIL